MDNIGDLGDLVVTGIHRTLRWQSDSHLDSGSSDHLDIQPGRWPAFDLKHHPAHLFSLAAFMSLLATVGDEAAPEVGAFGRTISIRSE